jgi:hypothetical protein
MRLGKLLSVGEAAEATEVADVTGRQPAAGAAPVPPVPAEAATPDGHREAQAAAEAGR